jgi:hypothetical protein
MPEEGTNEWHENVAYIISDGNVPGRYSAVLVI